MDRIIENGSKRVALVPPEREPVVARLRAQYPNASDDERLLRFVFAGSQVDDMIAAGTIRTTETSAIHQSLSQLLTELAKRPQISALRYVGKGITLDLKAGK
jgi:oxaloacetate decarboxylase alpha subunit